MKNNTGRSILSVVVGFLTVAILSTAMDEVMHRSGIFPPAGSAMTTSLWLVATAYRAVFQVLGGYLTARLAPQRPMRHVWILAIIGQVLSFGGIVMWKALGEAGGPLWYPILLILLATPTVWLGGRLFMQRNAH